MVEILYLSCVLLLICLFDNPTTFFVLSLITIIFSHLFSINLITTTNFVYMCVDMYMYCVCVYVCNVCLFVVCHVCLFLLYILQKCIYDIHLL